MMSNVYYDPKECGLDLIETLDEPDLSYEYRTLIVVRDQATGRLFYAEDAGCSCPTPFEDYHFSTADDTNLDEITPQNWDSFVREVDGFPAPMSEREDLIAKVRKVVFRCGKERFLRDQA